MNKKGIGILTITAILFAALFGMKTNEVYAASNSNNNKDGPSISYSSMANCPSNYYSSVEGLKGNALLEKIAEIKEMDKDEVARIVYNNAIEFYGLI